MSYSNYAIGPYPPTYGVPQQLLTPLSLSPPQPVNQPYPPFQPPTALQAPQPTLHPMSSRITVPPHPNGGEQRPSDAMPIGASGQPSKNFQAFLTPQNIALTALATGGTVVVGIKSLQKVFSSKPSQPAKAVEVAKDNAAKTSKTASKPMGTKSTSQTTRATQNDSVSITTKTIEAAKKLIDKKTTEQAAKISQHQAGTTPTKAQNVASQSLNTRTTDPILRRSQSDSALTTSKVAASNSMAGFTKPQTAETALSSKPLTQQPQSGLAEQKPSRWNKKKLGLTLLLGVPIAAFMGRAVLSRYGYNFTIPVIDPMQDAVKNTTFSAFRKINGFFDPAARMFEQAEQGRKAAWEFSKANNPKGIFLEANCDASLGQWIDSELMFNRKGTCLDMQAALEKIGYQKHINILSPEEDYQAIHKILKSFALKHHPDKQTGDTEMFRTIYGPLKDLLSVLKNHAETYNRFAKAHNPLKMKTYD